MKILLPPYLSKRSFLLLALLILMGCQSRIADNPLSPRFNHVYLNVSDMDRSVAFYSTAFELEQTKQVKKLKRTSEDGVSEEFDIYLSLLKFPGENFVLEIGENPGFQAKNSSANYSHLGIEVADIESASERILKAGGLLSRPLTMVETEDIKAKTIFFTGPDGETIELMQIISGDF